MLINSWATVLAFNVACDPRVSDHRPPMPSLWCKTLSIKYLAGTVAKPASRFSNPGTADGGLKSAGIDTAERPKTMTPLHRRTGNCSDNAAVETFFKTIKAELLSQRSWSTRRTAELAIFEYINGF